jgi:hypothetical protein
MWLPLFALCVAMLQVANSLIAAVAKMQWFLKRGRDQPLDAIGFVAAGIVFVVSIAARLLW